MPLAAAAPTPGTAPSTDDEGSYAVLALSTCLSHGGETTGSPGDSEHAAAAVWVAASVLAALMEQNEDAKRLLLRVMVPSESSDRPATSLLVWLSRAAFANLCTPTATSKVASPPSTLLILAQLQLLVAWITGCPAARTAFITPTATLPCIADSFTAAVCDTHVRGHLSALLGACLLDSAACAIVLKMVKQRLGLETYGDGWDAMRTSPAYTAALAGRSAWITRRSEALLSGAASAHGVLLYAPGMVQRLEQSYRAAHEAVLHAYTRPDPDADAKGPAGARRQSAGRASEATAARGDLAAAASPLAGSTNHGNGTAPAPSAASASPPPDAVDLDPTIQSFKDLIAMQDAANHDLKTELEALKEAHGSLEAELVGSRAASSLAEEHRRRAEERTEACGAAEAEAAGAKAELEATKVELSRVAADLESALAGYAQMEAALEERKRQLEDLQAGGDLQRTADARPHLG